MISVVTHAMARYQRTASLAQPLVLMMRWGKNAIASQGTWTREDETAYKSPATSGCAGPVPTSTSAEAAIPSRTGS